MIASGASASDQAFSPIITRSVGLGRVIGACLSPHAPATIPRAFSAFESVWPTRASGGGTPGSSSQVMVTSRTLTPFPIPGVTAFSPAGNRTAFVWGQPCSSSPAAVNAALIWNISSVISGCAMLNARVYGVPAKGFIAATISPKSPLSSLRQDRYFASSSCALAARSFATATCSSDLRLSSFWRSPAILLNMISRATPIATKLLASDDPHCSRKESYGGCIAAIATSAATPIITRPPPNHAHRSHDSMDFSSSRSLALITPFGRRHAGKGLKGFWVGVGVGALMFVILFAIHFLQ
jgi:hypothetical protein